MTSIVADTTALDNELEQFSNGLVTGSTFDDSELFKYFLNDEFVDGSTSSDGLLLSSPISSLDSNDSPQPSPPQLSPERNTDFTGAPLVSVPSVPVFQANSFVKIKEEPSTNDNKKNGRKRTSPSKEPETPLIPRDDLLKITKAPVNVDEEKQIKRQKRLIKNRESAQLSRLRKKIYIEELEKKVTHLANDNDSLTKQVAALNTDKKRLHEEVLYLQSIIKQSPELSSVLAARKGMQPKNIKAAGVCLLIILFSVGLLFNSNQNRNASFLRAAREDIPEVLPKSAIYTGRVLKSVSEEEPVVSTLELTPVPVPSKPTVEVERIPSATEVVRTSKKHIRTEDDELSESSLVVEKQQAKIPSSVSGKKKRMKISEEVAEHESDKGLVPLNAVQPKNSAEIVPRRNPEASYVYCPNAQYLAPATTSSGPELVALLLPANLLNGTAFGSNIDLQNSLLEVSCQVLNLHMWPLNNTATQQ